MLIFKRLIIFLSVICCLSNIINIYSQNDTILLPLTEIKVNKGGDTLYSLFKIAYTITSDEVKNLPVQSINDILDFVKSIDMRERGNMRVQADISIRGGTFEQTIILLNDIMINNPQTGHYSLDIPVSTDDIEKIEILKGPLYRINGANPFAGAINIITKTRENNNIKLSAAGGQHGWYSANGNLSINTGTTSNFISFTKMASDGYVNNTDFDYEKIYLQSNI